MGEHDIPDIVIRRLPIYVRTLKAIEATGIATVSSDDLAEQIGVTAAQIRRDLSYFGKFGKQGKGYDVPTLVAEIERILNLDRQWDVALIGYGHLGQAIAAYKGFDPSSFRISAIFDRNPKHIGSFSGEGARVLPDTEISRVVREHGIRLGIVAVPAAAAQEVTDALVAGGVTAVLNYAPVILRVPEGVWVREIDPTSAMQSMTYYLTDHTDNDDDESLPVLTGDDEYEDANAPHKSVEAADGM
ncbi:MAG: redox-sensing transcriptional repressor Rex [Chloroflexota bacterium]|nr:redox-sensing transcriptional repressor Rex [Chloroflexota bacterium]